VVSWSLLSSGQWDVVKLMAFLSCSMASSISCTLPSTSRFKRWSVGFFCSACAVPITSVLHEP
jgi:hypothetical protein